MNPLGIAASLGGGVQRACIIVQRVDAKSKPGTTAQKISDVLSTLDATGFPKTDLMQKGALMMAGITDPHVLQVQYNPSSLRIDSNVETLPYQHLQTKGSDGLPTDLSQPPSSILSVDLVFDAVNNQEAFLYEKFHPSTGSVVNAVKSLISFENNTVQHVTNGLLGALLRESTREITFVWSSMAFTGEMTDVKAAYTMFAPTGEPIRSVVTLSIVQHTEESKAENDYWNKAFSSYFSGGLTSFGGKSTGDALWAALMGMV